MPSAKTRKAEKEALYRTVEAVMAEVQAAVEQKAQEPALVRLAQENELPFGIAWPITFDGRSKYTRALVALGYAKRVPYPRGYHIELTYPWYGTQSLAFYEQISEVAATILTERLGLKFYVDSFDD